MFPRAEILTSFSQLFTYFHVLLERAAVGLYGV